MNLINKDYLLSYISRRIKAIEDEILIVKSQATSNTLYSIMDELLAIQGFIKQDYTFIDQGGDLEC